MATPVMRTGFTAAATARTGASSDAAAIDNSRRVNRIIFTQS
jgi:hypothetical protein